jgi:hypothetical protein
MNSRRPSPKECRKGATSRLTCNQVFSTTTPGTQRLTARRQHSNRDRVVQANHTLSCICDRIAEAVVLTGRQRHHHPTKVHPLGSEHLGKQPQPGARPRRKAAKPSDFQLPSCRVGTTIYRTFCVNGEHAAPFSTPNGATPKARTSIAYTCRTPHGNVNQTTATPFGTNCPSSAQSCTTME